MENMWIVLYGYSDQHLSETLLCVYIMVGRTVTVQCVHYFLVKLMTKHQQIRCNRFPL